MPPVREYDAFISYRHKKPDMEAAEKVQNLLERFHVPRGFSKKRIGPIFRDKTELPTGSDLGESIREALAHSRFLIVILSETTRDSKWCMEEIRYFKACHGGRTDRILPLLVSGEPEDVLPDILRYEEIPGTDTDGGETKTLREIEPLIGDIRADSRRGMFRKLKTEYLRLAAQILGCRFDDLYQRTRRHERRVRTAAAGSVIGLLSLTLALISAFAWRTFVSEQRYEKNLVSQLIQRGAGFSLEGDASDALLYFTRAMEIRPENETAAAGALLALQANLWVAGGDPEPAAPTNAPPAGAERFGTLLEAPGEGGQDAYVYLDGMKLTFCTPEGEQLSVQVPADENPRLWAFERDGKNGAHRPYARLVRKDGVPAAIITYGGYAYFYTFDPQPDGAEAAQGTLAWSMDLSEAYANPEGRTNIAFDHPVDVSRENGIAVIREGFDSNLCFVSLFDGRLLCRALPENVYYAGEVMLDTLAVSPDGGSAALFVRDYVSGYDNNNRVYALGAGGEILYRTETEHSDTPVCLRFSGDGSALMIVRRNSLDLVDAGTGERLFARLNVNGAADGWFEEDAEFRVSDEEGQVMSFAWYHFDPADAPADTEASRARGTTAWEKDGLLYGHMDAPEGAVLAGAWVSDRYLFSVHNDSSDPCFRLLDARGEEADRIPFPDPGTFYIGWVDAELPVAYFSPLEPGQKLYRCTVDTEAGRLGPVEVLDTGGMAVSGPIGRLGGGCAFYTPDARVVYYAPEALTPTAVSRLGDGSVVRDETAAAGGGRTVIAVKRRDTVRAELWDLREGLCLGVLESTERQIMLGDLPGGRVWVREYQYGWDAQGALILTYQEDRVFLLTAPEADRQTLDALFGLCNRQWTDSAVILPQTPQLKEDWDGWGGSVDTD